MNNKKNVYLNGLSVWALSFGGIIGWGCFIMPGTAFLPDAGPVGSLLGIFLATLFALLICVNYSRMIKQFPETGGSYVYTRHILGEDHAFLVAWCLLLAYLSLMWANATAFHYKVANLLRSLLAISLFVSDSGRGIKEEDFETLIHKLNLSFSTIQSEEELTAAEFDYFITEKGENYDSVTYIEPELFSAPKASILLVDDMPMNNRITAELLHPLCMEVDTASNGKEAIEKILAKDYDIVFMDHMMPVMDGIEAITEIRKMESEKYKELPVVALTANATVEAKNLFFECGFSDILSKPIRFEEVLACLRTWLKPGLIQPAMELPMSEDVPTVAPKDVEIPGVDPTLGVENAGNAKLFMELLGDVHEIIDSKCADIRTSMERKDWKAFTTDVHALKTTCRMIGAMELSNAFFELEKMGNAKDSEKILAKAPSVLSCFEALKPYLEPYAPKAQAPSKDYDRTAVEEILNKLSVALEDYDLSAAEECINQLSSYEFDEAFSEKANLLFELVRNLDYDEALDLVHNW